MALSRAISWRAAVSARLAASEDRASTFISKDVPSTFSMLKVCSRSTPIVGEPGSDKAVARVEMRNQTRFMRETRDGLRAPAARTLPYVRPHFVLRQLAIPVLVELFQCCRCSFQFSR